MVHDSEKLFIKYHDQKFLSQGSMEQDNLSKNVKISVSGEFNEKIIFSTKFQY